MNECSCHECDLIFFHLIGKGSSVSEEKGDSDDEKPRKGERRSSRVRQVSQIPLEASISSLIMLWISPALPSQTILELVSLHFYFYILIFFILPFIFFFSFFFNLDLLWP